MALHKPPIWPTRWLMTDARLGDRWEAAVLALPSGSGVVLRQDELPPSERLRLAIRLAEIAENRGLLLAIAGDVSLAERVGAGLIHRPDRDPGPLPFSLPVHDEAQADEARERGAALVFVSPVFATLSHPDAPPLGVERAAALAARAGCPAMALGGMNEARWPELAALGFHGWAGIGAWA